MATTKVTFTLDAETVRKLALTATQLGRPKSAVLREAIDEYHERRGRLTESERLRMLKAIDEMMSQPSPKTSRDVDREIRAIRAARRTGGRRTPVERAR